MFASANKGDTWVQKVLIPSNTGKPKSISNLDVVSLIIDPSDSKAFYFGSPENGLYYTYDKGENWQVAASLGKITPLDIAIDPVEKCVIYAASQNKVLKSVDCARTWSQIYYDNDPAALVTAIAVDNYNHNNVLIGFSRGDILRSADRGGSWQTSGKLGGRIEKIIFSVNDSRIIFAGTRTKGLFRSMDNGFNWEDLKENFKDLKIANNYRSLAISKAKPGFIILANNYGLISSEDNGSTWKKIDLISPEKGAIINSVSIGTKNIDEIYYVTNTTFYRTSDGGVTWTTKKMPTSRAGWILMVDQDNPNIIYMGVKTIQK